MAKKPVRYPKKLRQKLEKVAAARDERDVRRDPSYREHRQSETETWWQSFLPDESVQTNLARFDFATHTMKFDMSMIPVPEPRYVFATAPWLREEEGASE
jgi:hypothetical protein